MTPLSASFLAIVARSGGKSATVWNAIKKRANANSYPKNRLTTLQALEQTLNKIFLLNNGAKVITHYSCEEEGSIGMVAE